MPLLNIELNSVFEDDGGAFPYRLAGVGEQRHWFSEDDICWPVKKAQLFLSLRKNGVYQYSGNFLGVSVIRVIVFWSLYWGPPIQH